MSRATEIHYARVFFAQVRVFRQRQTGRDRFHFWLLAAASNARRRAAAMPRQRELFSPAPLTEDRAA